MHAASIARLSWYLLLIRSGSFMYGTDRHGVARVERRDRLTGAEELLHRRGVLEELDAPLLMAREEPVERDDRRQPHVRALADAQRADVQVVDRLRVAGKQDQPAGVQREVDVGVIAADVQRPVTVRVARSRSIGNRVPDWTGYSSEYSSPCELVALKTRPPPTAAP